LHAGIRLSDADYRPDTAIQFARVTKNAPASARPEAGLTVPAETQPRHRARPGQRRVNSRPGSVHRHCHWSSDLLHSHGEYVRAAELRRTISFVANGFGASHAQRDIIDSTLAVAAVRGSLRDLATALAHERPTLQ
jgi:hypothetical protein